MLPWMRRRCRNVVWVTFVCACGSPSGGEDTSTDPGTATGASTDAATASTTADTTAADGSSTGPAIDPFDGEPLDVPADGAWHFVEIDGMACNGGAPSGVGVRRVEGAQRLVLYFKGGGACFNNLTCSFTSPLMLTGDDAMAANPEGVLDFSRDDNPFIDANVVYVPYCTGDVHAGVLGEQTPPGVVEPWNFVGHDNVLAALDRVVPTFADVEHLVVLGTSAGGLGALINFPFIRAGWPETDTLLIDDSGVILPDAYLDPCLQTQLRDTWGLSGLLPSACEGCARQSGGGLSTLFEYLPDTYPEVRFALIASNEDQILRLFYGFGNDGCAMSAGLPDLGTDRYHDGLSALYTDSLDGRFVLYEIDSETHTWSTTPAFYTTTSGGVTMAEWFATVLDGTAQTVRP
jgi:hypothetical protein